MNLGIVVSPFFTVSVK